MKESLPINKEILKWARITIGLTSEEVASKMGKSETVILEWESGNSSPTYSQLEKLAYHVYKRPLAVFFFPDIPEEESPRTEFRTLPDVIVDNLPSELIKLYRKAKVFQLNLDELFDGNKPVDTNLLDRFSLKGINDMTDLYTSHAFGERQLDKVLDNLKKIEDEIQSVMIDSAGATGIWESALAKGVDTSDAAMIAIEGIGEATDEERKKLHEEAMTIINNAKTREEMNAGMINWIALIKRSTMSQDELADSNKKLSELGLKHREILLKNLKPMVEYGFITGKTADDLGLLSKAATELNSISKEERGSIAALALATLHLGTESGNLEGKIKELNSSLSGFGLTAEYVKDDVETFADESGLLITDMMGRVVIDTQNMGGGVSDVLKGVSKDTKKSMEGAGLYWTGIFGKALLAEVAFVSPIDTILGHQLLQLGEIAFNTLVMSKIAQEESEEKAPEFAPIIQYEGMQFGGMVEKTSLYKLHKGEEVIRAGEVSKGKAMSISIGQVNLSPDYPAQRFLEDLENYRFSIT